MSLHELKLKGHPFHFLVLNLDPNYPFFKRPNSIVVMMNCLKSFEVCSLQFQNNKKSRIILELKLKSTHHLIACLRAEIKHNTLNSSLRGCWRSNFRKFCRSGGGGSSSKKNGQNYSAFSYN